MSHTLRFSAFIAIVMLSFALAFHAVFHTCNTSAAEPGCDLDEDVVSNPLGEAFGTFGASFVTVFSSALGGPNFDPFDVGGSDCRCDLPEGAVRAGIFLMVVRASLVYVLVTDRCNLTVFLFPASLLSLAGNVLFLEGYVAKQRILSVHHRLVASSCSAFVILLAKLNRCPKNTVRAVVLSEPASHNVNSVCLMPVNDPSAVPIDG